MASKGGIVHACSGCGFSSPRWFGRCPDCGAWNSATGSVAGEAVAQVKSLAAIDTDDDRISTGIAEVDRVLGGGLVRGSVALLAGQPGIGKSTLLLQLLAGTVATGGKGLMISAEESLPQVARRALRLGVPLDHLRAVASSSLEVAITLARDESSEVVIVDSIQALQDRRTEGAIGSLVQVRECAAALVGYAKESGTAIVLVGHVTKEGSVAGPKILEHAVDAVLGLEGERTGALRLLRATKNRFGSCEETGVFAMTKSGLEAIADPSSMLLADRATGVSGSIVFPNLQGSRPVLVEIQALVADDVSPQPRRVALGVDSRRLALLLGVLSKHGVAVGARDAFVSAAGGVALREPAGDLAVCLAVESALTNKVLDPRTIAVGEVGLGGEVRRVPDVRRRLAEAARLGFTRALVPVGSDTEGATLRCVEVTDIGEAFRRVATVARAPAA